MIELLKFLAPWINGTGKQKAGSVSTIVALIALAIYAAQTLLLPALTVAPAPPAAIAPAPGTLPATPPEAPPVPEAPPAVDLDATPSMPLDGTSDGGASGQ
jgi:hypothetical protein